MSKPIFKISFRTILSFLTFALIIYVIYENLDDIKSAISHLSETNILVLLLLIPEQLFMYYCCGQMFFSYMAAKKDAQKISPWTLMRVSLELNFVNHAVPAGGLGGLGYITWRLKPFGATAGQSSFMYALRYTITICANQFQTIVAIICLSLFSTVPVAGQWVIGTTALISVGVIVGIILAIVIASSEKRMAWFAKTATNFGNWLTKVFTFGRKKSLISKALVDKYLGDINKDVVMALSCKRMVVRPILWGMVYSFLEIATYWIVAASLGRPDILPQIMIGEAIGSVMGAIVPYGLYELGMVGIMVSLGVDPGLSALVVLMTRVIVLMSTIISGYGFYQHSITKIGRQEQAEMTHES